MYIFSLALRKMPGGEGAMVVVGMPLSNIISQQLKNSLCPILTMSMGADITGTSCEATGKASLSVQFPPGHMTHSQMLGKFEYTRGPIFKVVLEC